jgi:hypothetical protein
MHMDEIRMILAVRALRKLLNNKGDRDDRDELVTVYRALGETGMRSAIMASGARRRSAVELLMERLVPFKQRPRTASTLAVRPLGHAADDIRRVRRPSRRSHQEAPEPQHRSTPFDSSQHGTSHWAKRAWPLWSPIAASWTSASCSAFLFPNPREGAGFPFFIVYVTAAGEACHDRQGARPAGQPYAS